MSHVAPLSILSSVVVLDDSLEGWSLLEPTGELQRAFRQEVKFSRPFAAAPVVQVGITGLDASNEDNLRLRVRAIDIGEYGFTLQADTWFNTRIWSIEVSWLAIGA